MKNNSHSAKDGRILTSILKRMLLILLFLANLAPTIQAEEVERQQNTGISINVSNVSLKNLFNILEQKSNYIFFYSNDAISGTKNTSIRTENEAITSILDKVLPPKQLTYTIKGRQIIVSRVKDVEKTVVPVAAPKNFRLKGKVVDAARQPLPGANVVVNGQGGAAAITDLDGNFTLDIEGRDKVQLSISYIGFQTKSISTGETVKPLFVVLEENAAALSEVVVVGYGTQKRSDVTGAISSFNSKQLEKTPQNNIMQALQGKVAGLNIRVQSSGAEDSGTKMIIRGQKSISASSDPLVILDGAPYDRPLSEINSNDIETIDVLKDASSAAIYGSRAANGVILITTKSGEKGKAKVRFDAYYGADIITKSPRFFTPEEYYKAVTERENFNYSLSAEELYNYDLGKTTDWYKMATRMGQRQQYNISLSGGSDNVTYYLSGAYANTKGATIGDDFSRYTIRTNIEGKITSWLTIGSNTQFGFYSRDGLPVRYQFQGISNAPSPYTSAYNEDGTLKIFPDYGLDGSKWEYGNVLDATLHCNDNTTRSVISNNYLVLTIPGVKGLRYKLNTNFTYRNLLDETYYPSTSARGFGDNGRSSVENFHFQDWLIDHIVSYEKGFGKHKIALTALYSAQKTTNRSHTVEGVNYPNDFQGTYQTNNAKSITGKDGYSDRTYLSQMGRANYTYDDKYLFTATVRRDGYSGFGDKRKFGIFPSVALGWNISEENFAKSLEQLSRAKLRISYGKNGNQGISPYQTMPSLSTIWYLNQKNESVVGYYPSGIGDSTLGWETTNSLNVGLDFGFFNGRIAGSFDIFTSKTENLLLDKSISSINGTTKIKQNIGSTSNFGYEIQISTFNIKSGDWRWTTDFNLAYSKNKIIDVGLYDKFDKPISDIGNKWFIGESINVDYGYVFDRIMQVGDEVPASQPTAQPGYVLVKDIDNSGDITTKDMQIRGSSVPLIYTSISNTVSYKGLSLTIFLNGQFGRVAGGDNASWNRGNTIYKEFWTPENPDIEFPKNDDKANPYGISLYNKRRNSCDFVRLQDVTLTYRLPSRITNNFQMSNLEFYINAKNLGTITSWKWGPDPEFSSQRGEPFITTLLLGTRIQF